MKTPMANRDEIRDETLTVPMSKNEKARVKQKAKEIGITSSSLVRIALNDFFKKNEQE